MKLSHPFPEGHFFCIKKTLCYDCTSWTIIFFPSVSFPPLSLLLYYRHPPFAPCNGLKLNLLSNTKTGARCLIDYVPPPLSITCFTFTFTVSFTCASVSADAHPLCPLCVHISLLLPYVSLHRWCTLSAPLTCVLPCPLCLP